MHIKDISWAGWMKFIAGVTQKKMATQVRLELCYCSLHVQLLKEREREREKEKKSNDLCMQNNSCLVM